MVEFTEEQEKEIQARVLKAQQDTMAQQQWAIAGDQFFRDARVEMAVKVSRGQYDAYVLRVGEALHESFRLANFPKQQEPAENEPKQD